MQEHVLSINEYNMPTVYSDTDAEYVLIVRLLLLDKGKIQSHPGMGVGLRTEFRYGIDNDILNRLKISIQSQISTYLPHLILRDVAMSLAKNILTIQIATSKGAYELKYNTNTEKMSIFTLDDIK